MSYNISFYGGPCDRDRMIIRELIPEISIPCYERILGLDLDERPSESLVKRHIYKKVRYRSQYWYVYVETRWN